MVTSPGIRAVVCVLLSVAYVLVSFWLMTQAPSSAWGAVIVLSPMLIAISLGSWRLGKRICAVLTALAWLALLGYAFTGLTMRASVLYLAQHVGIHFFLALGFGGTLRTGRTALITLLASKIHRVFTPQMADYTRRLTLLWTLYFVLMMVLSVLLYALASLETWALFANFLSPLTVIVFFLFEYGVRYRLHPDFERASLRETIAAFQNFSKPAFRQDPAR